MDRLEIRSRAEADLSAKLLEDPLVRRGVEQARAHPEAGVRRRLLSTALRVRPRMSSRLDAVLARCGEALGLAQTVELFVYPDASFNAACARPEGDRALILVSSSLLEAFDDAELRFVVGHELGHHLFRHHDIPVQALLENAQPPTGPLAMTLFAWSRYAEVSADRAGLLCAGGLDAAARSFFKLASGLRGGMVEMNADGLLEQVGDIKEELSREAPRDGAPRVDWFATHPFSPLRLRAARAFTASSLGGASNGNSRDALEAEVGELMSLMEPTYLEEKSEAAELMRRLLMAGGVLVAAKGGITADEQKALDRYFGAGSCAQLSLQALERDLPRRLADVRERVPALRRAQVLRDICLVALADGHVSPDERELIHSLARETGVEPALIDATLAQPVRLD